MRSIVQGTVIKSGEVVDPKTGAISAVTKVAVDDGRSTSVIDVPQNGFVLGDLVNVVGDHVKTSRFDFWTNTRCAAAKGPLEELLGK